MAGLKHFFLFGLPIQHSLSPPLHQIGFDSLSLPYKYYLCETTDLDIIKRIIKEPNFGGASITIPLKSSLWDIVDNVSDAAEEIGAINTVVKSSHGKLYGENTDWKGVQKLLGMAVPKSERSSCNVALIGAGGTARAVLFALKYLGFTSKIFLYNPHDTEQAVQLTKDNVIAVNEQSDLIEQNIGLVISTIPAVCEFRFDNTSLFQSPKSLPIVFDVNYLPYETCLMKQAKAFNCPIIRGIDLLIEQGLEQFQLWTNKVDSVESIIRQTVQDKYEDLHGRVSSNAN